MVPLVINFVSCHLAIVTLQDKQLTEKWVCCVNFHHIKNKVKFHFLNLDLTVFSTLSCKFDDVCFWCNALTNGCLITLKTNRLQKKKKKIPSITRVSNNTKSSVSPPTPHPRSHLHVSFSWEFSHARWSLVTPMGARREAEKQPDHTCHQVSGDHHPPHSAVTSIHTVTPCSTSNKCTDPQLKKLIHWKKHSLREAEQH